MFENSKTYIIAMNTNRFNLNENGLAQKFKFRYQNRFISIPVEQISHLEGDCNYTLVYTKTNRKFVTAYTLKNFENILDKQKFVRVHKSHIVNLNCIEQIDLQKYSGEIKLNCGRHLEVSRRKLKNLTDKIDKYNIKPM